MSLIQAPFLDVEKYQPKGVRNADRTPKVPEFKTPWQLSR
jgi:hypothetical protein